MTTSAATTPLLSILVPTRDRGETAIWTVQTILSIASAELELVVQDCGTENVLAEWVAAHGNDPRLQYSRSGPLSMAENWSRAITRATGEYVCVIGDDDGVTPEILTVARWAREHDLDAVAGARRAVYYWPGTLKDATLYLNDFSGSIDFRDAQREVLNASHTYGRASRLAMIYCSLVRRSILTTLRDRTGEYFRSTAPDLYSGFAGATLMKRYAAVDYPFTISGISKKSNSGKNAAGQLSHSIAKNPHLSEYQNLQWPELLPRLSMVATIEAEAMIKSWQATGNEALIRNFNVPFLYATCLAETGVAHLGELTRGFVRANRILGRSILPAAVKCFAYAFARIAQKVLLFLMQPLSTGGIATVVHDVHNVAEAVQVLTRLLAEKERSFGVQTRLGRIRRLRQYVFGFR